MFEKIKKFLFENTTNSQTIAKNTFWLAVGNFGGRLLRAGIIIYGARILGAYQWGIFNYAITITTFCTLFADIGMGRALWREIPRADQAKRDALIGSALAGVGALSAIYAVIIAFAAPYFIPNEHSAVLAILPIVALIVLFDALREFTANINRATERAEIEAGAFLFTNFAILVTGFFLLSRWPSLLSFSWAYAAGTGLGLLLAIWILRNTLKRALPNASFSMMASLIKESWPFTIASLFGATMVNMDIILIGILRSATDVGIYSAANRIIQLLYIIPAIIGTSTTPLLSRISHDKESLKKGLEKILGVAFLISLPLAIGGIAVGKQLLGLVFGSEYLSASSPLQILFVLLLIDFPIFIISSAMFVLGKQRKLAIYSGIACAINAIGDLYLIPRFGITGSAFATLIAQVIASSYLYNQMQKIQQFSILSTFMRIFLKTAPMGILALVMISYGMPVYAVIPAAAFVYLATLILTKEPMLHEALAIVKPR